MIATRIYDAPRALVFDAWTDPKHLAQWWGPYGFATTPHPTTGGQHAADRTKDYALPVV
jgi:uncharacterized protein YndB with AHSA1/START domain